jgi:hypothetical protein
VGAWLCGPALGRGAPCGLIRRSAGHEGLKQHHSESDPACRRVASRLVPAGGDNGLPPRQLAADRQARAASPGRLGEHNVAGPHGRPQHTATRPHIVIGVRIDADLAMQIAGVTIDMVVAPEARLPHPFGQSPGELPTRHRRDLPDASLAPVCRKIVGAPRLQPKLHFETLRKWRHWLRRRGCGSAARLARARR